MRFTRAGAVALSLVYLGDQARAQSQPATIPTAVAQAMTLQPAFLGKAQFVDGATPTDWPTALVPPGAKVIGGGVMGDSSMFRVRTAVFALPEHSNPDEVLRALLVRVGYVRHDAEPARGGFVGSEPPIANGPYCNGPILATFGVVDSAQSPLVVAIQLIDGEAGRQNCASQRTRMMPDRLPIKVPTVTPPSGVISFGGSSGWDGSGGETRSTLRTTMSVDSLVSYYTAQLVAGGWTSEGKPGIANGVAVQRFSFREDHDTWTAVLIIMAVGDRRELHLRFEKVD